MIAWREGRHAQADLRRGGSAWIGLALDRWMLGVVVNMESRTFGVGVGPVYFGVGL